MKPMQMIGANARVASHDGDEGSGMEAVDLLTYTMPDDGLRSVVVVAWQPDE